MRLAYSRYSTCITQLSIFICSLRPSNWQLSRIIHVYNKAARHAGNCCAIAYKTAGIPQLAQVSGNILLMRHAQRREPAGATAYSVHLKYCPSVPQDGPTLRLNFAPVNRANLTPGNCLVSRSKWTRVSRILALPICPLCARGLAEARFRHPRTFHLVPAGLQQRLQSSTTWRARRSRCATPSRRRSKPR